jgi:hypothetical protein
MSGSTGSKLEWSLLQMLELDAQNFTISTDMPHGTRAHTGLCWSTFGLESSVRDFPFSMCGRHGYSEVDASHLFYSVRQCLSFLDQFPHSVPFWYYYYQLGFPWVFTAFYMQFLFIFTRGNTKHNLFNGRPQCVPRSKHSLPRLKNKIPSVNVISD